RATWLGRTTLKASVRFSFQGPREPEDSEVGGKTLVLSPLRVKLLRYRVETFWRVIGCAADLRARCLRLRRPEPTEFVSVRRRTAAGTTVRNSTVGATSSRCCQRHRRSLQG